MINLPNLKNYHRCLPQDFLALFILEPRFLIIVLKVAKLSGNSTFRIHPLLKFLIVSATLKPFHLH